MLRRNNISVVFIALCTIVCWAEASAQTVGYPKPYQAPLLAPAPSPSTSGQSRLAPKQPVNDYSLRGADNSYVQAESGFSILERTRRNPEHRLQEEQNPSVGDARYSLDFSGLVGWGPVRVGSFLFIAHYKYHQSWGTDGNQIQRFYDSWLNNPSAETFLFPAKSLIRTHSLASEMRGIIYENATGFATTLGLYSQINLKRQGSSFLGEKDEVAETVSANEYFIPYAMFRFGAGYQSRIAIPFRTDIDRQDPLLSNSTYSFNNRGRGRLLSAVWLNELAFANLRSLLNADFFYLQYRYASITEDRDRMGAATKFEFPIWDRLRMIGRFLYGMDTFFLDKVRIPKSSSTGIGVPEEIERVDTTYKFSISAYYDFDRARHHRVNGRFNLAQTISTVAEFNTQANTIYLGYSYTLPRTGTVTRRVNDFDEDYYESEF